MKTVEFERNQRFHDPIFIKSGRLVISLPAFVDTERTGGWEGLCFSEVS